MPAPRAVPSGSTGKEAYPGSSATRARQRSQSAGDQWAANSAPGAALSAGSRSPTWNVTDIVRRRGIWCTNRTPSRSGTAMETDSSSSSASRSAIGPSTAGIRDAAR